MRISSLMMLMLFAFQLFGQDVKVATWNLKDIFNSDSITARQSDFQSFKNDLNPNIVVVQEYLNLNQLGRISEILDMTHYRSSDFVRNESGSEDRRSFEVGIISDYPITETIEYDVKIDGTYSQASEKSIKPLVRGAIHPIGDARGFLWCRIAQIKLIVIGVHLKSSSGASGYSDIANSWKREIVAAAIANRIADDLEDYPEYTILVAGDFNVGHSDLKKNGKDLDSDCFYSPNGLCKNQDGYDETHALLWAGLIRDVRMKNLTLPITTTTYPGYAGSPIDNIYVIGKDHEDFSSAFIGTDTYGSDHLPVTTTWNR